jgi:von Willebrand factor type A domain
MGGKRCAGLGRLLVPILLLCASAASAEDQKSSPAQTSTIIVLDGSRSMWGKIGRQSKVGIVRSTLGGAFNTYEDRIGFGLVAFGHRGNGRCTEAELLAKPGELSSKTPGKLLFGAGFKPNTTKPVAAALVEAAKQTTANGLDIVLITDGPDSCKANVCATAKWLKQAAPGLRIHVIGFDPKAEQNVKGLACVAQSTGGQFLTAANAGDLKQDLTTVLDAVAKSAAQSAPVAQNAGTPSGAPPSATPPPPVPTPTPALATVAAPPKPQPPASQAQPPSPPAPVTAGPSSPAIAQAKTDQTAPAAPTPAPQTQSVQAKAASDQGTPPAKPQPSGLVGPPAPTQTDMPKIAAPPPRESTAPSKTPPEPGSGAPVPVTFKALLTESGPQVKSGLIWRVFTPQPGPNGASKLVSTHRDAMPTAALVPGEYLVNAAFGLSNLTKKIKVESGRSLEETFVLNTGGLKLAAVLASGEALPPTSVRFDILSDEEDQFGNRHSILENAKPGLVIRLNAGAYHIVSLYGDANATVRADVTVEPGKITEATVKHAAAAVTFKLVQSPGGEALADTKWTILTPTGDVVKENTGALPTHILAAGNYAVVANHNGESYTNKFMVVSGQTKQIEVVMQEGPASPEALKAITEPPPPSASPPGQSVASPGSPDAMPANPSITGAPPSPDSGVAFGNGEGSTPREPGLLPNPGALLRPRLP